jgi:glycosyltransferase involved in cell wall biosynthesis
MLAYNHDQYIAQAIESVLRQTTEFDFELVIGEDCSPDRTRQVAMQYASQYPERVRLILHDTNVGMHRNLVETLEACRGQYVAFLEGDDFWTSDLKLQKQAAFLDSHPEFVICSHPVQVLYADRREDTATKPDPRQNVSLRELIEYRYPLPSCGVMIRNGILPRLPAWFYEVHNCDYAIQMLLARQGRIHYMDEVMGTYRKHQGGVSESTAAEYQLDKLIYLLDKMRGELDSQFHPLLLKRIALCHRYKARYTLKRADLGGTFRSLTAYAGNYVHSIMARET